MREVFTYEYDEIARIVGKSQANCRQLVGRARNRIESGKPQFEVSRENEPHWPNDFLQLARTATIGPRSQKADAR